MSTFDADNILNSSAYREEATLQRTFMAGVFGWMTIGLLLTALTALMVASSQQLRHILLANGTYVVLIIAQLVVVLVFNFALRVIPTPVAAALFLVYSLLVGVTLSVVLLVFTQSSVAATFFITAGMFAGMSAFGYITGRDLSGLGSFCIMGLWGLFIALIVNMFLQSDAMSWLISFVGVIVFTGLTAFDTQRIKQSYASGGGNAAIAKKNALFGAFVLYLDFINLFLYLLRFMGNRKN